MTARTPTPPQFAELAHTKTLKQWAEEIGASIHAVKRMARQAGVKVAPTPSQSRPAPDGFAALAHTRSAASWAAHYGCSTRVVRDWADRCGVKLLHAKDDPAHRAMLTRLGRASDDEADAIMDAIHADPTPRLPDAALYYRALQAFRP